MVTESSVTHCRVVISKALGMPASISQPLIPLLSPSHTGSTLVQKTLTSMSDPRSNVSPILHPSVVSWAAPSAPGPSCEGLRTTDDGETVCQSLVPYPPAPPLSQLSFFSTPCPLPSAPNNKTLSPSMPCPSQSLWGGQGGETPPCWSLTGVLMRSRFPPSCGLGPVKTASFLLR